MTKFREDPPEEEDEPTPGVDIVPGVTTEKRCRSREEGEKSSRGI
jgi:hypothetical protein